MTYGQYSLNNSLNYKRLNAFTGTNTDFNKQVQDTATQSAELAKQNIKQNNLGGAAVDTFDNVKENPVTQIASMGAGLGVSAGLGALYKGATWGDKSTETAWYKVFNNISQNGIVKKLDENIIKVGNFIKDKAPKFLKEGEIPGKFKNGLENFKGGQQELFTLNKDFIEGIKKLAEKSKAEEKLLYKIPYIGQNLKIKDEKALKEAFDYLKTSGLSDKVKNLDLENLAKSEITAKAQELAKSLEGSAVSNTALKPLKGIANRVHILETLGKKGPITKALSDTSMFFTKMISGSTIGLVLNAVFMGQTVKAVIDAKPEDRHKVLAEEIANTWIGTMLLLPVVEKAFNGVMNFRHIGLTGANLAEMRKLEKAAKTLPAKEIGANLKKIAELAKLGKANGIGQQILKTIGKVLSIGMNRKGPIYFFTAAARVAILWIGLNGVVSDACKGIAHMITGAPPDKEKEAEAKKKAEAKSAGAVNQAVNQAAVAQVVNKSQTNPPVSAGQPVKEANNEVKKEEQYVPSAFRDTKSKKSTANPANPTMAGNPQVLSVLSKSDKLLKQAESQIKNG